MDFFISYNYSIFSVWTPAVQGEEWEDRLCSVGGFIGAGHTPYGEKVGRGFTDIISEELAKKDLLASFNKDFAMTGETSAGLLETLKRTGSATVPKRCRACDNHKWCQRFYR